MAYGYTAQLDKKNHRTLRCQKCGEVLDEPGMTYFRVKGTEARRRRMAWLWGYLAGQAVANHDCSGDTEEENAGYIGLSNEATGHDLFVYHGTMTACRQKLAQLVGRKEA